MQEVLTRSRRTVVVATAVAALVTAANASQGAYFSQSWGWVALAFLVPSTIALILGVVETPGLLRIAFAALVLALGAWIALSATWSISPAGSLREVERMLVYAALALALALLMRRGDAVGLASGVFLGCVAIGAYALATHLFQDVFGTYDDPDLTYRLSEPIGYWNALGLLMVIGVLLGLAFTAHARRTWLALAAAAALPTLSSALYFTFSRGAWIAVTVGALAMVITDARRLRLLWTSAVVAWASIALIAVASRRTALTTEDVGLAEEAVSQGRGLAVWVAVMTVASVLLAYAARWASRRAPIARRTRRAVDVLLGLVAVATVISVMIASGGPRALTSKVEDRFRAELVTSEPGNLNQRLFNLSGTGRMDHLQVAWDAARERPVVGNGAGTYEYFWYLLRPILFDVRDAHSLYVEMLAEVGIVGLSLLLLALALPVAGAFRARRSRVAPAAFGAFAAWAAHSAMDWHWEVVGVTAAALLTGGACMLAAERRRGAPLREAVRIPAIAGAVVVSVVAVVSFVGNQALFAARDAARAKDWTSARDHARRADALLPWSFEPLIVRGDAEAGLGNRPGALAAYRDAVGKDDRNWVAWLRRAQVARGAERAAAYARVRALNPLEEDLPGEASEPGS